MPEPKGEKRRTIPFLLQLRESIDAGAVYYLTLKKGARLYSGMSLRFDPSIRELEIIDDLKEIN